MLDITSIEQFYQEVSLPEGLKTEIGHFNVFEIEKLIDKQSGRRVMPYSRRAYYKISLIKGRNRAEYADKVVPIETTALLFATPKIPYHYVPEDAEQSGDFCVFSPDFLAKNTVGVNIDEFPIFQPGVVPIFQLSAEETTELEFIFTKMHRELASDYTYKFDLLRNLVLELIHFGQKLQPLNVLSSPRNASDRISSLFVELLERQFPIDPLNRRLGLRSAKDYAERLAVHVNHLNKVLKEKTGKTTTEIISNRIVVEAKILLKQTDWNISEISYALGFDELAHFSNFFKKQTSFTPLGFRSAH